MGTVCNRIGGPRARAAGGVVCCALAALALLAPQPAGGAGENDKPQFHDLSLLVAPELPCNWSAGAPPFQINHYLKIGPHSAYNSDILTIDEHIGTQFDAPAHFVPAPGSGLPNAGEAGLITADKVPAWQFVGEACVIDCTDLLDKAKPGHSPLVTKQRVIDWEKSNRPLGPGDVVLFRSGFSDKYYRPMPAGRGFVADPLAGTAAAWPDPDPDCVAYLASRKVMTLATDSPSMGPLPGDLPIVTHLAGLRHGMIWTEGFIGAGKLPTTGAFYCMIGPHHANGSGAEGRAFAITGDPLAAWLNKAARAKRVADLSVRLDENVPVWWPGPGVGHHRHPYYAKIFRTITKTNPYFAQSHTMDSHTGTHLVPPAYALPRKGFDNKDYDDEVRGWLAEYEKGHGPRGTSDVTTEKVPLDQTCGWTRVIDVTHLAGTTDKKDWPASPEITAEEVRKYEAKHGELKAGEVVVFRSGWSDRHCKAFPEGDACLAEPLNGKREGWPAPGPGAIAYLAKKGIRCVATDGPTLGGAGPKRALMTYWALGGKGMVGVEYLTNVGKLPEKAYFLFAPVKIRDCHGGPGRAIALY